MGGRQKRGRTHLGARGVGYSAKDLRGDHVGFVARLDVDVCSGGWLFLRQLWVRGTRETATNPLRNLATAAECEGKRPFLPTGTPSPSCAVVEAVS